MYLDNLWAIALKDSGKIIAGFSPNAYTSKGRAEAAIRKKYGESAHNYEAIKLMKEESVNDE